MTNLFSGTEHWPSGHRLLPDVYLLCCNMFHRAELWPHGHGLLTDFTKPVSEERALAMIMGIDR